MDQPNQPSGILLIDKPSGWTSHDVVNRVRRIYKTKKVGHAGTLDPMATGVLVVLVGRATKLSDKLLSEDKEYLATISFGQATDTGDADGQIFDTDDASTLTEAEATKALAALVGQHDQQVPAYSAVKVNGQKLYDLARAGKVMEDRPVRHIIINRLELKSFDQTPPFPAVEVEVSCSKGTYIRVLAEEIAAKLDTIAHLTALRRTKSGQFTIDQAVELETLSRSTDPESYLLDITE